MARNATSQGESLRRPCVSPVGTKKAIADFSESYTTLLKEAFSQDTSAKVNKAYQDNLKKLQEKLKGQSWTFNCDISDITKEGNGTYRVEFAAPPEMEDVRFPWRCMSDYSLRLTEKEALEVKSGDTIIISGKPTLAGNGIAGDVGVSGFFSFSYPRNAIIVEGDLLDNLDNIYHRITLQKIKVTIKHK